MTKLLRMEMLYSKHLKNNFKLPFFMIVACLLRMGSFFNLILDYDEWTYWEIARQMLAGAALYTDLIDLKAPGIFYIFMLIQKIAFHKMLIARVLAAILLGAAAYSIGRIGERLFRAPGLLSGMLFLLHFNYAMGLALNTELFYVSFTAIGAGWFICKKNALLRFLGLLLMGFAFSIKVFAAVDIFFLITLLALWEYRNQRGGIKKALHIILMGALTFIPFLLIHMGYYLSGHWGAFYEAIYVLPGRYTSGTDVQKQVDLFALYHFRFIWIIIPAYWGVRILFKLGRDRGIHSILWLLLSWFLILLSSRLHDHYWLQLAVPMSLFASVGLQEIISERKPIAKKLLPYFLLGLFTAGALFQTRRTKSTNASIHAVLASTPALRADEQLWVANGPAIFYTLLDKDCPGKYVHGSLSFDPRHARAYGIDRDVYWADQLRKVDCVIFCGGSAVDDAFLDLLESSFQRVANVGGYSIWKKTVQVD
ncbi:MAG: hypothetical protein H6606_02820 [Flavobacteriales bacterium]|nr:hypothetical protein [Flavobacteriales bacterium]